VLRGMRDSGLSNWTRVAIYRILRGTFALALRRGIVTRSPVDSLAASERPKQQNKRRVRVLDVHTIERLVAAGSSERRRTALGLACYAGLRLGEIRGLRWSDVDRATGVVTVRRSLLRDGTAKPPKTSASARSVPLLPALRRLLAAWELKSPHTRLDDYVIATADAAAVSEANLRRALESAMATAALDASDDRLSWHSLRHSFASMLATDLELPATTLAELVGHTDAGFTLKVYARDGRDTQTVVSDVLARAASASVGS
jgi:integrase